MIVISQVRKEGFMKTKIKVFLANDEGGLLGLVRNFFIKLRIKKSLKTLRELPPEKIEELLVTVFEELLVTVFTEQGYTIIKGEDGTTFIKEKKAYHLRSWDRI